jgi:hypothetical protein
MMQTVFILLCTLVSHSFHNDSGVEIKGNLCPIGKRVRSRYAIPRW